MSDDDFEFDDDEDFELDDSGVDDEPEFDDDDDDAGEPEDAAPAAAAAPAKPHDPDAKVPFFKNWVWWMSLMTAVPAGLLLWELFNGFVGLSERLNLVWTITMVITFLCAVAVIALPLLVALRVGKLMGGEVVTVAPGVAAGAGQQSAKSDITATPDDFDDDEQELFDSEDGLPELEDSEVFGDDDDFDDDDF